jgi:hypothetical protein
MRRYHLCEIGDKSWFPGALRGIETDIIEFSVVIFRIYETVIPHIREVMRHMKTTRIIDLCSGSAGPWSQLLARLQEQEEHVSVTLTDKYPNLQAFNNIKVRFGDTIQYIPEAVDTMNVPAYLKGIRTIFSAFHHVEPDAARKILQNAVDSRSAIGIFEFTEKRLFKIVFAFLLPLFIFFITLFVKPRTFQRIFWSNIIPLMPLLVTYDAIISHAATYSPEELKGLVKDINSDGYEWKIGQVPSKLKTIRITYLIGCPKDPVLLSAQSPQEACKDQELSLKG